MPTRNMTPAMKRIFDPCGVPLNVKKRCELCGFCLPVYAGRYPKTCQHCGVAFSGPPEEDDQASQSPPPSNGNGQPSPPANGGTTNGGGGNGAAAAPSGGGGMGESKVQQAQQLILEGYDPHEVAEALMKEGFAPTPGTLIMDTEEADEMMGPEMRGEIRRRLAARGNMNGFPEPIFPPPSIHPGRLRLMP